MPVGPTARWCGHGCGRGADSLAMDALTNVPLNYSIGDNDGSIHVECSDPDGLVWINSDSALCFLYAANGSTNQEMMLPAPPVMVHCNHTAV